MIATAEKQEIKETAAVVQFNSTAPTHNSLVPSITLGVRKDSRGIVLDWPQTPRYGPNEVISEVSADIVARSEQEVRKYPKSSRALTNLATAFANTGNVERAIVAFREALKLNPRNYVASLNFAKLLTEQNRLSEAEDLYRQLCKDFPRNITPLISLAVLAMRKGDFNDAECLLEKAASFGIDSPALSYHFAVVLLHRNEIREAIKRLKAAVRMDVRSPALYQALGIAYAMGGDNERSNRAFNTALNLAPNFGDAVRGLANTFLAIGHVDAATQTLSRYLERTPSDLQARLLMARAHLANNKFLAARAHFVEVYEHVTEITDNDRDQKSEIANDLGVCLTRAGDLRSAEQWFLRSIEHSPRHGSLPYRNVAGVYLETEKPMTAVPLLQRGKELFPTDDDLGVLLAQAWDCLGRIDRAIAELEPRAALNVHNWALYSALGCYLADVREYDRAIIMLDKAHSLSSRKELTANNLAYVYLMAGQTANAAKVLDSVGNGQDRVEIVLTATRGLLRLKMNDPEGARALYTHAAKAASQQGFRRLARYARQKMHLELARYFLSQQNLLAADAEVSRGLDIREGRPIYQRELEEVRRSLPAAAGSKMLDK